MPKRETSGFLFVLFPRSNLPGSGKLSQFHTKNAPSRKKEGAQEKQLYDDDYITMIEKTRVKIAQVSTTPRIIR